MPNQPRLIDDEAKEPALTDEEKAEYIERLRQKLQDPEFRQIKGFPIGDDEAILDLSAPPYYTACPNPFLPEIIERWQQKRERIRAELGLSDDEDYHREPFASDVSEGKGNAIYNAHTYHTKVPHRAIMRYILHYTDPGDIVFDGFCGTGMAGVAAQLCNNRDELAELGYHADDDDIIYDGNEPVARVGARRAIVNDLSPAAAFIAYNYNTPLEVEVFEREAERILQELDDELGWMYETWHPHCEHDNRIKGQINFTVWSDIFICPECNTELILWDVAVDPKTRKVKRKFSCPHCGSQQTKRSLDRAQETVFDPVLNKTIEKAKRVPVLISYEANGNRYEKEPDVEDLALIRRINQQAIPFYFPTRRIDDDLDLWYERDYRSLGIYSINAFYTKRNLYMTSYLWHYIRQTENRRLRNALLCWAQSVTMGFSLLNRYRKRGYSQVNQLLSGTLYVGAFIAEISPWYALQGKISSIGGMSRGATYDHAAISTASADAQILPKNSVDYIFVDPPFGSNIIYSDLSIIWESWLKLFTNPESEAVVHRRKKDGHKLSDYQVMMEDAFARMYATLKSGRWMTVEFHNTKNAVWNAIQEALLRAGFVVADVRTMDKEMATFKQVTASGAVKADLIISAYKPRSSFEQRFAEEAGTVQGAWQFVRQHLAQLPVVVHLNGTIETLSERQDYLLFDRMVAFHIQRGATVPLSAAEFYAGLRQRFVERDGMFFLPDQVIEYDRARMEAEEVAQLSLFVDDEKSTIQWLRQELSPEYGGEPQTYQEIQPKFLKQLHQARHEDLPELSEILEENFLQDEQDRWYVPDPSKASDLEKLRQKALLREFAEYTKGKKQLKQFRTEAVRAGFAHAWQERDYRIIVDVAERLPEEVLQEDPDLLMYYDNAGLRVD